MLQPPETNIRVRLARNGPCSPRPATDFQAAATPLETGPPTPSPVSGNAQTRRSAQSSRPPNRQKLQSPALVLATDSTGLVLAVAQKFSPATATAPDTHQSAQLPNSPAKNIQSPADSHCARPIARDSDNHTAPRNAPESLRSIEYRQAARASPAKSPFSAAVVP